MAQGLVDAPLRPGAGPLAFDGSALFPVRGLALDSPSTLPRIGQPVASGHFGCEWRTPLHRGGLPAVQAFRTGDVLGTSDDIVFERVNEPLHGFKHPSPHDRTHMTSGGRGCSSQWPLDLLINVNSPLVGTSSLRSKTARRGPPSNAPRHTLQRGKSQESHSRQQHQPGMHPLS